MKPSENRSGAKKKAMPKRFARGWTPNGRLSSKQESKARTLGPPADRGNPCAWAAFIGVRAGKRRSIYRFLGERAPNCRAKPERQARRPPTNKSREPGLTAFVCPVICALSSVYGQNEMDTRFSLNVQESVIFFIQGLGFKRPIVFSVLRWRAPTCLCRD